METKDWFGIMQILWVEHVREGEVIHREEKILNTLHYLGENFLLLSLFKGGNAPNVFIPDQYYLGLDSRSTIAVADTSSNLTESFVNGYMRQPCSSTTGFTIEVVNGVHRASSQIVTFSASGGGWGPVKNIFLSDKQNTTGILISSAKLSSPLSVVSGDYINMQMALSLRYCPSL